MTEESKELRPTGGWSKAVNGISIRAATDKEVYAVGEKIYLTLQYRNEGSTDEIIPVNSVPDTRRGWPQNAAAPIYSVDSLHVTFRPASDNAAAASDFTLHPLQSSMFSIIPKLYVIKPGEVYSDTALLNVWSWGETAATKERTEHGSPIGSPGHYRVGLVYPGRAPGLDPSLRDHLRAFFATPNPTHERFIEERFYEKGIMLSFDEAQRLRPWDWRLWEGSLRAEDFSFTIR